MELKQNVMYKVYPEGYDPHIAYGPPYDDFIKMGISWTPEETKRARELEKQYEICPNPVTGRWNEKIREKKYEQTNIHPI